MKKIVTLLGIILSSSAISASDAEEFPQEAKEAIFKLVSENGWGGLYYDVLPNIINENNYKNLLEIGVAFGGHAEAILTSTNILQYYGVDPYLCNYDPADAYDQYISKASTLPSQRNFDYVFNWVKDARLSPFLDRCILIRESSLSAINHFKDESIDCIFIDGDHRYEAVLKDLYAWYPKLKKGGMLLGDDYWMDSVKKAVQDFACLENLEPSFIMAKSGYVIYSFKK